jgi:hypothetical protein
VRQQLHAGKTRTSGRSIQGDCWAASRKANSQNFLQTAENECQDIVEGSAPSKTKEEPAHTVRAGDVGAFTTLGSFACIERKRRMIVINLGLLAPYKGAAGAIGE